MKEKGKKKEKKKGRRYNCLEIDYIVKIKKKKKKTSSGLLDIPELGTDGESI